MPWFKLSPVTDERFFDTAPIRFDYEMHLPVPADEVWAGLTADRPLGWCKMLSVRYTSPRPFGVGTKREVGVQFNMARMKEHFFIWDEAKRCHAFYVEESNAPLLDKFAEYYEVTPTDNGCVFVWRFAMQAKPGVATVLGLSKGLVKKLVFDRLISDTEKCFRR